MNVNMTECHRKKFTIMGRCETGFALVELLAAFAIAALVLAAFYGQTLAGLTASSRSARHAQGLAVAESRLGALDAVGAVVPGTVEGDEPGGFHWAVSVVPIAMPGPSARMVTAPMVLYDVAVTVGWSGGGSVRLASRRTGPAPR